VEEDGKRCLLGCLVQVDQLAEQDGSWHTGERMLRNRSKSNQAQKPRILLKVACKSKEGEKKARPLEW